MGTRDADGYWLPPTIEKVEATKGTLRLTMSLEIRTRDASDGKLLGFAIAGKDRRFCPAEINYVANGPRCGACTWRKPRGKYGVARLSPWLLFSFNGLNLKQGVRGGLFGYGYLPLPLTDPKATTGGKNVPTVNHGWTLFLTTANFKGPVAFFTPFFWSQATIEHPEWAGLMLDSRPAEREVAQKRVEKLHRAWSRDRAYVAPPDTGKLAALDPALILTPPKGMEPGYVPIATRRELETP